MRAPVVLFTYNRPLHTKKAIESLLDNKLADNTHLFIYSDAPKTGQDVSNVMAVRDYLHTITGFKSLTIHERESNMGLADSIIDGVSSIIDKYDTCIVLEDDIVTSPSFLEYMNTALHIYQNESQIMHIAAHMQPINPKGLPESFFMRQSSCWGWATWKRAWQNFHRRGQEYIASFTEQDIKRFNLDGAYDYWSQLMANENGTLKTWAVYWYACVFSHKGLCLHPRHSLVQNTGFDGSGENCGVGEKQKDVRQAQSPKTYPDIFKEHKAAMQRYIATIQPKTSMGWKQKMISLFK